ncbi:MAG: hypothetical protein WCA29_14825 [Jiangellales bacterium]
MIATVAAVVLLMVWTSDAVSLGSVLDLGRYQQTQTAVDDAIARTSQSVTDFGSIEDGTCYTRPGFMTASYASSAQPSEVPCTEPHLLELISVVTLRADEAAEPGAYASACERDIDWNVSGQLPDGLEATSLSWLAARWEGREQFQSLCFAVGPSSESLLSR